MIHRAKAWDTGIPDVQLQTTVPKQNEGITIIK